MKTSIARRVFLRAAFVLMGLAAFFAQGVSSHAEPAAGDTLFIHGGGGGGGGGDASGSLGGGGAGGGGYVIYTPSSGDIIFRFGAPSGGGGYGGGASGVGSAGDGGGGALGGGGGGNAFWRSGGGGGNSGSYSGGSGGEGNDSLGAKHGVGGKGNGLGHPNEVVDAQGRSKSYNCSVGDPADIGYSFVAGDGSAGSNGGGNGGGNGGSASVTPAGSTYGTEAYPYKLGELRVYAGEDGGAADYSGGQGGAATFDLSGKYVDIRHIKLGYNYVGETTTGAKKAYDNVTFKAGTMVVGSNYTYTSYASVAPGQQHVNTMDFAVGSMVFDLTGMTKGETCLFVALGQNTLPFPIDKITPSNSKYALMGTPGALAVDEKIKLISKTSGSEMAELGNMYSALTAGGYTFALSFSEDDNKALIATVTAVPPDGGEQAPATYAVTVNGGTGGGAYAEHDTVTITADTPPAGQRFANWTVNSGGAALASASSPTTTFAMPANAVEVTAHYEAIVIDNGGGDSGNDGGDSGGSEPSGGGSLPIPQTPESPSPQPASPSPQPAAPSPQPAAPPEPAQPQPPAPEPPAEQPSETEPQITTSAALPAEPQPTETANGRETPPKPTDGGTLVDNGDGTFLELSTDGTPLGTWRFNEELGEWLFEPIPQGGLKPNPKTGQNGLPLLPIGVAAAIAATAAITRKRRGETE